MISERTLETSISSSNLLMSTEQLLKSFSILNDDEEITRLWIDGKEVVPIKFTIRHEEVEVKKNW